VSGFRLLLGLLRSHSKSKQALINDLLRQKADAPSKAFDQPKADAVKAFDEKLAKLGYQPDGAKPAKKSHHKRPAVQPSATAKAKDQT
jgi:hypothetical protein